MLDLKIYVGNPNKDDLNSRKIKTKNNKIKPEKIARTASGFLWHFFHVYSIYLSNFVVISGFSIINF